MAKYMCKDCLHFEHCANIPNYPVTDHTISCDDWKHKDRFIEVPVKVGQTVFYIIGGYYREAKYCKVSEPCKVVEISFKKKRNSDDVMLGFITDNGTRYSFNGIGKTVFLTKEEAEKALAERNKDE